MRRGERRLTIGIFWNKWNLVKHDSTVVISNGCNTHCVGKENHPHGSRGSTINNYRLGQSQFSSAAKECMMAEMVRNKKWNRNSHSATMTNS